MEEQKCFPEHGSSFTSITFIHNLREVLQKTIEKITIYNINKNVDDSMKLPFQLLFFL